MTKCEKCKKKIPYQGRGRPRKWCEGCLTPAQRYNRKYNRELLRRPEWKKYLADYYQKNKRVYQERKREAMKNPENRRKNREYQRRYRQRKKEERER